MNAKVPFTVYQDHAVVGLRVNLIHNSIDRVLVPYELKRETIKDSINQNQSINCTCPVK